ncbi:MAG: proline/glycine betaine ABC transporter ATP-binding protein [Candidatus Reconcilbacillus cellulovorans]|uniref:Quaternary amine transport ATP-binding protein n=1 Tax=Candidatus Reconcilbacillus cellulovorans TaxID=1906605 RepID=A0A2A6DZ37_9BACL|nr:MAG: proline/glycine betaine ABC transporter ATP-binding protein [Candidatus Reconcilbacillus cellulovorans]
MIRFERVTKTYPNGHQAVKSLTMEIGRGEFVVLVGPSGCGKTTTMKMINRLVPHTEGVITIDGQNVADTDPVVLRRNIGYVIQQIGLFPHLTVEENIELVPSLKGWSRSRRKKRAEELMELVGLEPGTFARRYPKELSGGQQQRVGVARALAADPDIILMDEPFGALDPITREQLQDELLALQRKLHKTIVFVTHDMDEALKVGDRIAVMKDGVLLQFDTPDKLLKEPVHEFVEQFIGKKRIYQNPELVHVVDVMRENPAVVPESRSPARALAVMRQRRTDTLLVSDEHGKLRGIVSAYDLQAGMESAETVGELMRPVEAYLDLSATAKDALLALDGARFGVIPVVGADGRIVGVVTRGSLLSLFARMVKQEEGKEVHLNE